LATAALFLGVANSQRGQGQPNPPRTRESVLEDLWKLRPPERMSLVAKHIKKGDVVPAERGAVSEVVIERASLDATQKSEIVCRVNDANTVIMWVVDDGAVVKKGDKLIEFDAASLVKEVAQMKNVVASAAADLRKAEAQFARLQKDAAIDIKLAEIDVRLADLAHQQYKGNDPVQKQILALQVDRARLLLERIKLNADTKLEKAATEPQVKKKIHDFQSGRLQNAEAQIANYVVKAPQDGMVIYHVPEQRRNPGPGNQAIVAQGEPVRLGQKLMTITDLKQMNAVVRVHEAYVSKVRVGQKATIRVDAFPNRTYTGKVTDVATVADQAEFFKNDVKLYRVNLAIDGQNYGLRPGMSAETTITVAERANCLRLPIGTVLTRGKDKYCYVQVDKELQVRKLTIGVTNGSFVEVVDGLKEGDPVLQYPHAVVDRLIQLRQSK
jgi:RND family efflux transporter MFP subunit